MFPIGVKAIVCSYNYDAMREGSPRSSIVHTCNNRATPGCVPSCSGTVPVDALPFCFITMAVHRAIAEHYKRGCMNSLTVLLAGDLLLVE